MQGEAWWQGNSVGSASGVAGGGGGWSRLERVAGGIFWCGGMLEGGIAEGGKGVDGLFVGWMDLCIGVLRKRFDMLEYGCVE